MSRVIQILLSANYALFGDNYYRYLEDKIKKVYGKNINKPTKELAMKFCEVCDGFYFIVSCAYLKGEFELASDLANIGFAMEEDSIICIDNPNHLYALQSNFKVKIGIFTLAHAMKKSQETVDYVLGMMSPITNEDLSDYFSTKYDIKVIELLVKEKKIKATKEITTLLNPINLDVFKTAVRQSDYKAIERWFINRDPKIRPGEVFGAYSQIKEEMAGNMSWTPFEPHIKQLILAMKRV